METGFKGVYSILLTPMKEGGELDLKGLEALIEHNIRSSIHGLVILGSNGEFPYLSLEEKKEVIRIASAAVRKRVPLICGASSAFTREAIAIGEFAAESGCDALLSVLECYYPLEFKEVIIHYQTLCSAVKIPVFYYNIPELTGLYLSSTEFKEVLCIPGIIGAKNSQVNFPFFKNILAETRGMGKAIFTGAEFNLHQVMKLGAMGAMGPLCNIWPEKVLDLYNAAIAGKDAEAALAERNLFCLMPLMGGPIMSERVAQFSFNLVSRPAFKSFYRAKPTMAMLKEAIRLVGVPITAFVRPPLPQLTKDDQAVVEKTLARMNQIKSDA
jgi:dihydrodipicolinate synthase/N-acetylneuraminate lyase